MITTDEKGYSASVDIRLLVNGKTLDVAQIKEWSLILRDKCDVAPGTQAEVVISVDGDEVTYPVFLHLGIDSDSELVQFL